MVVVQRVPVERMVSRNEHPQSGCSAFAWRSRVVVPDGGLIHVNEAGEHERTMAVSQHLLEPGVNA